RPAGSGDARQARQGGRQPGRPIPAPRPRSRHGHLPRSHPKLARRARPGAARRTRQRPRRPDRPGPAAPPRRGVEATVKVLALDMALTRTGVAWDGRPDTWAPPGQLAGAARLEWYHRTIRLHVDSYHPDLVAVEGYAV